MKDEYYSQLVGITNFKPEVVWDCEAFLRREISKQHLACEKQLMIVSE